MTDHSCPFCSIPRDEIIASNDTAFAIRDIFPVSPGHMLIIPYRHVSSWFESTEEERLDMLRLMDDLQKDLEERKNPSAYNIGINVGEGAGQTVMHVHIHLIPRYPGDVDDPMGGIRAVISPR